MNEGKSFLGAPSSAGAGRLPLLLGEHGVLVQAMELVQRADRVASRQCQGAELAGGGAEAVEDLQSHHDELLLSMSVQTETDVFQLTSHGRS